MQKLVCCQLECIPFIPPEVRGSLRLACWGKDRISEEFEGDGAEKCSRGTGFSSTYIQIIAIRTLRSHTCRLRLKINQDTTYAGSTSVLAATTFERTRYSTSCSGCQWDIGSNLLHPLCSLIVVTTSSSKQISPKCCITCNQVYASA